MIEIYSKLQYSFIQISIYILNGIIFDFYFWYFTKLGIFIVCNSIILLKIGLIKLKQTNQLLEKYCRQKFVQNNFYNYRRHHLQTLTFFEPSNRYYGRIFFSFLLVNFPTNAWLLMISISGKISRISMLFMANIITLQIFVIFCIHLIMAKYPRLMHRPAKMLLGWKAKNIFVKLNKNQISSLRCHIHLDQCIGMFHTTNLYAITHVFGKVTLGNLAKV